MKYFTAITLPLFCFAILSTTKINSEAATFYVDYSNGNDLNSGQSKSAPWKHSPQMQPFRGKYIHSAGDQFIFRGGVTWPNAALPLFITNSGTERNPDYYGVDTNWYSGSVWSRPVFDAEGIPFTNHDGNRENVIWIKQASHVRIDNIEMKQWVFANTYGTSQSEAFCVYAQLSDDITVENIYAHDWVVNSAADGKFGGLGASASANTVARNCVIAAPTSVDPLYVSDPTGRTSGCGVIGFNLVDGCEFIGTTQGIWGGGVLRNNTVRDGQNSFDSATHENAAWIQNTAEFYNNKIYNAHEGVGAYFLPGWGKRSGNVLKVYNNIFSNTAQINLTPQDSPDSSNEIWFFNNVVQQPSFCIQVGTTKSGAPFGKLVIQNNIFISEFKYSKPHLVIAILDQKDLGNSYFNDHNVIYTSGEASNLGMNQETSFRASKLPLNLINRGVNRFSLTRFDRQGVLRPESESWDIGPYFYSEFSRPSSPKGVAKK